MPQIVDFARNRQCAVVGSVLFVLRCCCICVCVNQVNTTGLSTSGLSTWCTLVFVSLTLDFKQFTSGCAVVCMCSFKAVLSFFS